MKTSRSVLGFLLFLLALPAVHAATLTLNFYDTNGAALSFSQVKALQTGPQKGAYQADAFVNPTTLSLISATPMTDAGSFTFNLPSGQPAAFAINWPTASRGYGLIIVDNGGAGFSATATVNFTYQAAKDILRKLNAALAARPDYVWSTSFTAVYQAATNCVAAADASSVDSVKGAQGQLALEQLVVAYDTLLKEYGPVYAHAHQNTTTPWLGFTMEDVSNYKSDMNKLAAMAGPYGWVRIVFQPGSSPSDYTAAVSYAKSVGIKVMGLCVDSSQDTSYTRAQYLTRYQTYITAFPNIDCWEVGNEVNGGWSSSDIAGRVSDVAAYCKAQGKKTYLTLFWQINTADTTFALFNWITNNLPATVRSNLDYVGLSQYQEQAPVGVAFDQVMRRMQQEFPQQQIGLGELGYWISGQQYWWAYNSANVTTAKDAVLAQYYNAVLGYAGANGGCFWWNFSSTGSDPDFDSTMSNSIDALSVSLQSNITNTPPVVTNTPPVVTNTPPVVTNTPPVVTNTPPVVTNTPPVVTNTPPVVTNTPPVVTNTPPVVTNTPPVVTNTPPVVTNTPPVVTNTPPVVTNTPPVVTNTPPVVTNTPPVVTNTPPVVTNSAPLTVTVPAPVILSPTPALASGSQVIMVSGGLASTGTVAAVWCQIDASGWTMANGTTNWTANVTLSPGTNKFGACATDSAGNRSATNWVSFMYAQPTPPTTTPTNGGVDTSALTLVTNGPGGINTHFRGNSLVVGNSYTVTAVPGAGQIFSNWTGSLTSAVNPLKFVLQSNMVLQANFVPNPFAAAQGSYNGLFYDTNGVDFSSAGFVTLTLTGNGNYTARLQVAGRGYYLSGRFDASGAASQTVAGPGTNTLTVTLALNLTPGANQLTGTIGNGTWVAELTADRAVFSARANPATAYEGNYTIVIPGSGTGDGYGTVYVNASGVVVLNGSLADGTAIAQDVPVSQNGEWPLYVSLYGGRGLVLGWITFTNEPTDDLNGLVSWIKLAQPAARYYPAGLTNETSAVGSRYVAPAGNTNQVLQLTNGIVTFSGGNLAAGFTNTITLNPNNTVVNGSPNPLTLYIRQNTGLFTGYVADPSSGGTMTFKGALLQKQDGGSGYLLGTNQSATVSLAPLP